MVWTSWFCYGGELFVFGGEFDLFFFEEFFLRLDGLYYLTW